MESAREETGGEVGGVGGGVSMVGVHTRKCRDLKDFFYFFENFGAYSIQFIRLQPP